MRQSPAGQQSGNEWKDRSIIYVNLPGHSDLLGNNTAVYF